MGGVDGVQVAGEAAEDAQPLGAPAALWVRSEERPGQGKINANMLSAGRLGVGDKAGQQGVSLQLCKPRMDQDRST
jgi:hypothetical protein